MKFTLDKGLDEFSSTFKEWHYLIGGASAGFIAGVYIALKLLRNDE